MFASIAVRAPGSFAFQLFINISRMRQQIFFGKIAHLCNIGINDVAHAQKEAQKNLKKWKLQGP
jgi:hypothetical protein